MSAADESTPLLGGDTLSDQSTPKIYSTKNKSSQTAALLGLLVVLALAAAATIWIFSEHSVTSTSGSSDERNESLKLLLNNSWPRSDSQIQDLPFQSLLQTDVDKAIDEAKKTLEKRESIENYIEAVSSDSPSYRHQHSIVFSPRGYNVSKLGYVENEATKYLKTKGYGTVIRYDSAKELKWASESECIKLYSNTTCITNKYRTVNGSCNNLLHPEKWGVAMTPFRRSLPANYSDGVSDPRGGFKTDLPSARDISTLVHRPVHREDNNFSVMLAVWGQFIDHDITATALSRGKNGSTISCCNAKIKHPECFPVLLNETDEYYSKYNIKCIEFVRSAPALRCSFGPREQLNQASSYLDGSMIYGNTEELSHRLRSFQLGKLEVAYTSDGRAMLPASKNPSDGCNQAEESEKGRYCFLSGDDRANENIHLTSIHLIFVRQHNLIVEQLAGINPHWSDETLYQEGRRIVIAQVQHITYNEFLPIIIGPDMMMKLELYSLTNGVWNKYNKSIDATIANNFATSSFRFAHTLIPRVMKLLANDTSSPEYVEMHKMLFNPFGLYKGDLDAIIRGAINTDVEKADNYFTTQLTEHLFEKNSKPNKTHSYGLDLVALNIQRGRDHGLPTYPHWREHCGLSRVTTFDDLHNIFDEESLKIISSIYKNVYEIDLYTGSLSENPIENGLLGPTLTCLIADQFFRLKHGDRYWYETNEKPQAFTEEQLNEIRKTSLAGILCQNSDDLENVTPFVMKSISAENNRTACNEIPQPDWTKFRDDTTNKLHRTKTNSLNLENVQYPFNSNSTYAVKKRTRSHINSAIERNPPFYSTDIIFDEDDPSFDKRSKSNNGTSANLERRWNFNNLDSPIQRRPEEVVRPTFSKNESTNLEENRLLDKKMKSFNDELERGRNFTILDSNLESKHEQNDIIKIEESGSFDEKPNLINDTRSADSERRRNKSSFSSEIEKYFPEIFRIRSLLDPLEKNNKEPKIYNTTLVTDKVNINNGQSYDIIPPIEVSKQQYSDTLFTWRLSPQTKTIRGNFSNEKENGTFELEYKNIEGIALNPDCIYYSKISPSPDFELNSTDNPEGCSKIVPVIFDERSWDGNITISVHDLPDDLKKENEMSLNSDYTKIKLKNITGHIIISILGNDILVWNGTLPAVFQPEMSWLKNNDTAAFPVSWSGFDMAGSFTGTFMLAEKVEDTIVWHEGRFSLNLGRYKDLIEPVSVHTAIVYLTNNDDNGYDITEIEEITDWDLKLYSRLILKGNFSESKFYWNGDLTLVLPKIKPTDEDKSVSYRPYTRYAGEILTGTLYAELNGPKYLWWSGVIPSTIFLPVDMPSGYKQVFDHAILWTFEPQEGLLGRAVFLTYSNNSRIQLSGDFEFKITSVLNSPDFSPNTTYYSPIILQQSINDFNDDVGDLLSNRGVPGNFTLAPITLLGKYFKNERVFAWNRKFVISIVDNY